MYITPRTGRSIVFSMWRHCVPNTYKDKHADLGTFAAVGRIYAMHACDAAIDAACSLKGRGCHAAYRRGRNDVCAPRSL